MRRVKGRAARKAGGPKAHREATAERTGAQDCWGRRKPRGDNGRSVQKTAPGPDRQRPSSRQVTASQSGGGSQPSMGKGECGFSQVGWLTAY